MKRVIIWAVLALISFTMGVTSFVVNDMTALTAWYQENQQQIQLLDKSKNHKEKNSPVDKQDKKHKDCKHSKQSDVTTGATTDTAPAAETSTATTNTVAPTVSAPTPVAETAPAN